MLSDFVNSICSVVIILIFIMYSWYVKKDIFVVLKGKKMS